MRLDDPHAEQDAEHQHDESGGCAMSAAQYQALQSEDIKRSVWSTRLTNGLLHNLSTRHRCRPLRDKKLQDIIRKIDGTWSVKCW
jgi:hypothetical protein